MHRSSRKISSQTHKYSLNCWSSNFYQCSEFGKYIFRRAPFTIDDMGITIKNQPNHIIESHNDILIEKCGYILGIVGPECFGFRPQHSPLPLKYIHFVGEFIGHKKSIPHFSNGFNGTKGYKAIFSLGVGFPIHW